MKAKITYGNKLLSNDILIADTTITRMVGLMFKPRLEGADGLLINPCNSIHTFFMRYNLDIVFMSKDNKVVKIIRDIKPWRMTWIYFKARKTLELPAGKLPSDIREGDVLEVNHV